MKCQLYNSLQPNDSRSCKQSEWDAQKRKHTIRKKKINKNVRVSLNVNILIVNKLYT